jgi:hypothetical protein
MTNNNLMEAEIHMGITNYKIYAQSKNYAGRGTAIYQANITRCLQSRKPRGHGPQWLTVLYT